jgi:hypothetical protein
MSSERFSHHSSKAGLAPLFPLFSSSFPAIPKNLLVKAHGIPMRIFLQDRRVERVPVRGNIHHLVEFPS